MVEEKEEVDKVALVEFLSQDDEAILHLNSGSPAVPLPSLYVIVILGLIPGGTLWRWV